MDTSLITNWTEIDLSAIQNNIKQIQQIAGRPVMAIVKANAYGHGAVDVALAADRIGITWFGVARIEEAVLLRQAGIQQNILVLGYTSPDAALLAQAQNIHVALYDRDVAELYSAKAAATGKKLSVHIKIDSGMGRLGVFPQDGVEFIRFLGTLPGLQVAGVFTHFARADEPDQPATAQQITRFDQVIEALQASGLRPPLVHASNSSGTLNFPNAKYDMVRPGIILYGLSVTGQGEIPPGFTPALQWKCRISSIKTLPSQHGISYGHRYVTTKAERVGAITVGYADGYRRTDGNIVLIRGQRTPVIGRVCMDQAMISLEGISDVEIGDEVVLIGRQGQEQITAEEVASRWGTINDEVVTSLAARVHRIYTHG